MNPPRAQARQRHHTSFLNHYHDRAPRQRHRGFSLGGVHFKNNPPRAQARQRHRRGIARPTPSYEYEYAYEYEYMNT